LKPKVKSATELLVLGAVCLALTTACSRRGTVSGPLPQEIYVWQRVWNKQVEAALAKAGKSAAGFAALAAEIDLREGEPKIFRPNLEFAALKASGRPISLTIRIDPFSGPFNQNDRATEAIVRLARDVVATAHEHDVDLAELQIDFDCGEWKLDDYRTWLRQIRAALAPLPVTPTILPSWLKHRAFAKLAHECGGFILQVHSVALPQSVEETRQLTDPARAVEWVEQAARVRVPFRVSLPTYSYLVAFDAAGKLCGISAEGPSARWPREARVLRWDAQPDAMANLLARWQHARPGMLRGVCWYRLPVAVDNLNWRWKTLEVVMQGRAPKRQLRVVASRSQPSEIVLVNEGEADESLPKTISARWSEAKLIAADALEGYELKDSVGKNMLIFELNSSGEILRLPPNGQHKIGWIRCESSTAIDVSFAGDSSRSAELAAGVARNRP
jgi:Protein of unknown function (DUF3142)